MSERCTVTKEWGPLDKFKRTQRQALDESDKELWRQLEQVRTSSGEERSLRDLQQQECWERNSIVNAQIFCRFPHVRVADFGSENGRRTGERQLRRLAADIQFSPPLSYEYVYEHKPSPLLKYGLRVFDGEEFLRISGCLARGEDPFVSDPCRQQDVRDLRAATDDFWEEFKSALDAMEPVAQSSEEGAGASKDALLPRCPGDGAPRVRGKRTRCRKKRKG